MMRTILAAVVAVACSTDEPKHQNVELGVVDFRVTETAAQLEIIGVDARYDVIARVHLRVGPVTIPEEQLAGLGRELTVEVRGTTVTHRSVGIAPLSLPRLRERRLDAFLLDPYVASVLASWDVALDPASGLASSEVAYGHGGSCSGFIPACGGTQYTSCCLGHVDGDYSDAEQAIVCGNNNLYARRACKGANQMTRCGLAGPAGCAVCWSAPMNYYNMWTWFDEANNYCNFGLCGYASAWCLWDSECCSGSCNVYDPPYNGSCN
jgi:hypothetical protein